MSWLCVVLELAVAEYANFHPTSMLCSQPYTLPAIRRLPGWRRLGLNARTVAKVRASHEPVVGVGWSGVIRHSAFYAKVINRGTSGVGEVTWRSVAQTLCSAADLPLT